MDNQQMYEIAFQIIVHAGESRSLSSEAIDKAENYEFDEAEELLGKANEEFLKCHKIQTDMLTSESNGQKNEINIMFIHAQDHLTMATLTMENAKRFIKLYKKMEGKNEKSNIAM